MAVACAVGRLDQLLLGRAGSHFGLLGGQLIEQAPLSISVCIEADLSQWVLALLMQRWGMRTSRIRPRR